MENVNERLRQFMEESPYLGEMINPRFYLDGDNEIWLKAEENSLKKAALQIKTNFLRARQIGRQLGWHLSLKEGFYFLKDFYPECLYPLEAKEKTAQLKRLILEHSDWLHANFLATCPNLPLGGLALLHTSDWRYGHSPSVGDFYVYADVNRPYGMVVTRIEGDLVYLESNAITLFIPLGSSVQLPVEVAVDIEDLKKYWIRYNPSCHVQVNNE